MWRAVTFLVVGWVIAATGEGADPPLTKVSASAWIQQLSHDLPRARATAARALAQIGGADAVAPLIERLSDSDADVKLQAAFALGRINKHPEQSVEALAKLLRDGDEHVRYSAQWSMGQIAQGVLDSELGEALDAQRLHGLFAAASGVMAETRAPETIVQRLIAAGDKLNAAKRSNTGELDALVEGLKADDIYLQVLALSKLKNLDAAQLSKLVQLLAPIEPESILEWKLPETLASLLPDAMPAIVELLGSKDESVVDVAIAALSKEGANGQAALKQLVAVLADPKSSDLRLDNALVAIANIGQAAKPAVPHIAEIVANGEQPEFMRQEAILALGAIGTSASEALASLKQVVAEPNEPSDLRVEAAGSVVLILEHPEEAIRFVKRTIAETDDLELASGVGAKLGQLKTRGLGAVPVLLRLLDEKEISTSRRQELVLALGEVGAGDPGAISTAVGILTNPEEDSSVQVAAALAIGKLGPAAVGVLAKELSDSRPETRLTILRAMVELGKQAKPATGELVQVLNDAAEHDEIRVLAAVALGKIGAPAQSAVPGLTKLLFDQGYGSELRAMCATALGDIDPNTESVLQVALDDESKEVQTAAAYAIAKLQGPGSNVALQQLLRLLADEEANDIAARALADIGESAVPSLAEVALDAARDPDSRAFCMEVLAQIGLPAAPSLLQALNDKEMAKNAQEGLQLVGDGLIPALLIAAEDAEHYENDARLRMQEIVRYFHDGLGAGGDDLVWGQPHPLSRYVEQMFNGGASAQPQASTAPRLSLKGNPEPVEAMVEGFKTVQVFYGTNRKAELTRAVGRLAWCSIAAICALTAGLVCLLWQTPKNMLAIAGSGLGLLIVAVPQVLPLARIQGTAAEAPSLHYGGEYSDRVELGVCEVTIPDIHEKGELEGPSIFRLEIKVDPEKHITLRHVDRLEYTDFFTKLDWELDEKGKNLLVFVHGYNVSFEDAARRTAQMSSDLKFPGAAVFYSWPSQGHWYKYRVDEQNVAASVDQLKSFLLAVAEETQADTINLVAHSMGNRVLTGALQAIDQSSRKNAKLFNQVVLAAPDIDAAVFKNQIAPAIVTKAERVTLYASSKDLALYASRQFNSGEARAGDVGEEVVVVPGIETIDASAGDSSLLGHCYYGSSVSILRDIEKLLQNQSARERPCLHPISREGSTYWLFEPTEVASAESPEKIR
jgi:esterase/lipase superfamily enzyme/HEAT repeat protein